MASEAVCDLGTKIITMINKEANEGRIANCGEVMELMAILNCNVADWIAPSMKAVPTEILASLYTSALECHDIVNKKSE